MPLDEHPDVCELISIARREDLGDGDITSTLLGSSDEIATFELVAREPGVLAGQEIAPAVLSVYSDEGQIDWAPGITDGASWGESPLTLATLRGPLGSILTCERVLLNFLQRLCGVATKTRLFVEAVSGTGASILDTRKTIPGWRQLDKYAVRCGGGENHRFGLYDALLMKDNHLAGTPVERLAQAVFEMLNRMHAEGMSPSVVEVEADSLDQVRELLKVVGINVILLDNFSLEDLRVAVAMRNEAGLADRIQFEASGGITLDTVRQVAETGVDRISVGSITHSAVAVDLALERR